MAVAVLANQRFFSFLLLKVFLFHLAILLLLIIGYFVSFSLFVYFFLNEKDCN